MNCCRRTLLINAKSRGCVKTVLSVRLTFADSNGPLCPSKRTDQGGDRRSAMRDQAEVRRAAGFATTQGYLALRRNPTASTGVGSVVILTGRLR